MKKSKLLELESKLTPSKYKTWNKIKDGLREAELIEQGKIEGKTVKDFLNDL